MTGWSMKPYLAEFAGTFLLVLFAAGAVTLTARIGGEPNPVVCGLSSGTILAVVIRFFGPVSGAHVNPALTVALAAMSRIRWRVVPGYVLAQLAGSAVAGLTVLWLIGDLVSVGANVPNTAIGMTAGGALVLETILSFVMMMTILLCGDAEGGFFDPGAIRIGAIVGLEVMLFGPISGAAMSPARAFGPYLASGDWSTFWIYVAGPFAGIMAPAIVWRLAEPWRCTRCPPGNLCPGLDENGELLHGTGSSSTRQPLSAWASTGAHRSEEVSRMPDDRAT